VTIHEKPKFTIITSPDTILESNPISLTLNNPDYSGEWSNGEISNYINVSEADLYSVTVTDSNNCKTTEFVRIYDKNIINKDVLQLELASEIITPDDNSNKTLQFNNIEEYSNCNLLVFNKWGQIVANISNYKNDWNCTYKGSTLSSGAYYFIVTSNRKIAKGNFNILRSE
jgi:gliding motility-associated-like protein